MPQLSLGLCCVPCSSAPSVSRCPCGCATQQADAICSGALDTEVEEGDTVTFISTLHGG